MTQHLNREQSTADRANHGMHRVPDGIYPRNFVGKKFEEIENTGNADDPRIAEDFERLILRRESNPVEMNGEPSGKNSEVKVDASEGSQAQRDSEQIKSFHGANIQPRSKG
jgi:hypothetical protein